MRRVLLLVTDLERGGTPLRIARIARRLPQFGVEPIVGCLAPPGPLSAELAAVGIETFACGARHRADFAALGRFGQVVRRYVPDVVHASLFHANIAARLFGRAGRSRPIITASATIEVERRWHRIGEALTIGLSDLHLANSDSVRRHLCDELGFPPSRVVVVGNGIDLSAIDAAAPVARAAAGVAPDLPLVVWAGRMDPVKRIDRLLSVLDEVAARRSFSLALFGDGPLRRDVEARVATLRWRERVHVLGWRDDLIGWLKSADLFVLASRTEGAPNVVLEALAAGCPVVASDIAPCRELLEEGRGTCVDWESAGVAEVIEAQLCGGVSRKPSAERGRRYVEQIHELGRVCEKLSGLYDRLCDTIG